MCVLATEILRTIYIYETVRKHCEWGEKSVLIFEKCLQWEEKKRRETVRSASRGKMYLSLVPPPSPSQEHGSSLPRSWLSSFLATHLLFLGFWIPILCHLFLSSSSTHHLTFCSTRKEQKFLHYPISFLLDLANLLLLVIFRSENIILYLILQA